MVGFAVEALACLWVFALAIYFLVMGTPKGPYTQIVYIHWPQSTDIGTTLRPKYILFGYIHGPLNPVEPLKGTLEGTPFWARGPLRYCRAMSISLMVWGGGDDDCCQALP